MGCHHCTTEMFHWFSYLPAAILMYFWTFWPRIFSRICLRIYCLYGLNSCWNHCNTLLLLQTGTWGVSQTCNNFSGTLSIQVDILKFNIIYILCILIKSITVLVVWYFWRRGGFVLFLSFNFIYSFQFNASSYWNREWRMLITKINCKLKECLYFFFVITCVVLGMFYSVLLLIETWISKLVRLTCIWSNLIIETRIKFKYNRVIANYCWKCEYVIS